MRKRVIAHLVLAGVFLASCATAPPTALPNSTTGTGAAQATPCAWPNELDAVVAAPQNHRVLLENEKVRVLDVTVAPGEREPVHAHCWPSVLYVISEGVYRDYDAAGMIIEEQTSAPPASAFPITLWMGPQAPHAVENLDTKPVRLLRIEFKQ